MGRFSSYPTLYDEVLQINISKLKAWGYINNDLIRSGVLTWRINGEKHSSISITTNTVSNRPYLELNYKSDDQPINYKVWLVTIPSNLGKGRIWYFQCPHTFKLCRKLYLVSGYFLHRDAFDYCMYESQTRSKYTRQLDGTLGAYFQIDQFYDQLNQKHFKRFYAGKPTKKYLKIITQIQKAEGISFNEVKKLLYSKLHLF